MLVSSLRVIHWFDPRREHSFVPTAYTVRRRGKRRSRMAGTLPSMLARCFEATPCMGLSKSSADFTALSVSFFLPVISFVQPRRRLSSVPTAISERRRAQGRSRSAVAPNSPQPQAFPGRILTAPSTAADLSDWAEGYSDLSLFASLGRYSRGARCLGAKSSRRNLVSGGSDDPYHDARMRIGGEAPRRWTHS